MVDRLVSESEELPWWGFFALYLRARQLLFRIWLKSLTYPERKSIVLRIFNLKIRIWLSFGVGESHAHWIR